jgi:peroxiredoxin Q/BCP
MKRLVWILGALPLFALGCSKRAEPTAAATASSSAQAVEAPLAVGDPAPDVDFAMQDGRTVKLSSLRGQVVAVYFYPKDQTHGCTIEAQGIRDRWEDLRKAGVTVIGISTQDAASHKAFIDKERLPFNLAVDTSGAIARAFHVPLTLGLASRQSFLIGKDGKISKIWLKVTPASHAAELLAAAAAT